MNDKFNFGLKKNQFTNLHNIPGPRGTEIVDIANDILNGKMLIKGTNFATGYNLDDFDWNIFPDDDSKDTYQLYLFALYPIDYLFKAFEFCGNSKYARFAIKLLKSWLYFASNPENISRHPIILRDHCIALRAESLVYSALVLNEYGLFDDEIRKELISCIEFHAELLCDSSYYSEKHNHGIFQDRALLYIACFLNNEKKQEMIDFALKRLINQRNFAFTDEMVSVENSYDYHLIAIKLFREVAEILNFIGGECSKQFTDDFGKAADFLAFLLKPDGYIPLIGDSKAHKFSRTEAEYFGGKLQYSAFRGKSGCKPDSTYAIYPKSGYFASRQYWSPEDSFSGRAKFINSMWTMFKSGYISTTHKHADDLSFMMYCKGHDIFVDTGVFSYSKKSKLQNYFSSALAHNTVIVDGKSYPISENLSNCTGFFDSFQDENYKYVGGFNNSYNDVFIDRHFYTFDETIILFDNIKSENQHIYSQLFHLSPDMSIVSITDSEVFLKLADTGYSVRISQLLKNTNVQHFYGENENNEFGIMSNHLNELKPIHTLKFDVAGENVDIVTVISVIKPNGRIDGSKRIKFSNLKNGYRFEIRKLNGEDYFINAVPSERVRSLCINVDQNSNGYVTFINKTKTSENDKFAWEFYDENDSLIHREAFSDDCTLKFPSKDIGCFKASAIVQFENGLVCRSEIKDFFGNQFFDPSNGVFIIYSNSGNTYTFTCNCSLPDVKYSWYVYKKSDKGWTPVYPGDVSDELTFKYFFSSKGRYRVKVVCKNKIGDKFRTGIDFDI